MRWREKMGTNTNDEEQTAAGPISIITSCLLFTIVFRFKNIQCREDGKTKIKKHLHIALKNIREKTNIHLKYYLNKYSIG